MASETQAEKVERIRRSPQAQAAIQRERQAAAERRRARGRVVGAPARAAVRATEGRYRPIIVAEFVACVVMLALRPFLAPVGETKAESPSLAHPFIRVSAVMAVFFVLALASNGPQSGRIAAAFGGLVTLGVFFDCRDEIFTIGGTFSLHPAPTNQNTY